ncbi:MAG: transcription antitermination factor NusB [Victivallales bacterium]|nr:transcription antitermination factor NusB [Victivallales bacterium]
MSDTTNETTGPNEKFLRERRFARQGALLFLYQADQQSDWGNFARNLAALRIQISELPDCPEGKAFDRAWAFTEKLSRGVCDSRDELDERITECATNWRVERMSVIDRNIIRLTAYQLLHCPEVPPAAAINEAIELAKGYGHKDSSRFVNGVLDRLLRQHRESAPE